MSGSPPPTSRIHQRPHFGREVVAVAHDGGDRRAERFAAAHACQELHLIAFDLHARTAPVAALAASERFIDGIDVQPQMGGNAVEDTDESGAVRLAGGQVTEHVGRVPSAYARPATPGTCVKRTGWLRARAGGYK